MAAAQPIEGDPGRFRDPDTGEEFDILAAREDDKYDTIEINSGAAAINAGTSFEFFQNLQNKRKIDSNLRTPSKLAAGEKLLLDRVGIDIRLAGGDDLPNPSDVKKVAYNGFFQLKVNDTTITEGPAYKYPSGYGLSGQTQESGQGVLSIGVPSTAAAAMLAKKHLITGEKHEIEATLQFLARGWFSHVTTAQPTLANVTLVCTKLHGLIRAPATT